MAREKKKPVKTATTRARDTGAVRLIGAEVDPALDDALERCAGLERRSKKAVITLALEEYLAKAGLWPPAEVEE